MVLKVNLRESWLLEDLRHILYVHISEVKDKISKVIVIFLTK